MIHLGYFSVRLCKLCFCHTKKWLCFKINNNVWLFYHLLQISVECPVCVESRVFLDSCRPLNHLFHFVSILPYIVRAFSESSYAH